MNNSSLAAAAASGLPIVATRGPHLEAPFVDGYNTFLCPPKDPVALAKAIETVMNDPALQKRLSDGALELASEWYSWDRAIDRLMSLLTMSNV
jgi:glycosyltransferase involved in cell wall biosynthesis